MIISGSTCHIILKQGILLILLFVILHVITGPTVSQISKEIDQKINNEPLGSTVIALEIANGETEDKNWSFKSSLSIVMALESCYSIYNSYFHIRFNVLIKYVSIFFLSKKYKYISLLIVYNTLD